MSSVNNRKAWASKCTASSHAPGVFFFSCLSSFMYLWWMMWYRILTKLWVYDVQTSPRLQKKLYVFLSPLALKLILPGEHFNGFIRWTCYSSSSLTLLMTKRLSMSIQGRHRSQVVLMTMVPLLHSVFSKSWGKSACIRKSIFQGSQKPKLRQKER